jgi:hypothetical protein
MSALASLSAADRALVEQIDAAARALDTVATTDVEQALARLATSARLAQERLESAGALLESTVAGVLARVQGITAGIAEELKANAQQVEESLPANLPEAIEPAQRQVEVVVATSSSDPADDTVDLGHDFTEPADVEPVTVTQAANPPTSQREEGAGLPTEALPSQRPYTARHGSQMPQEASGPSGAVQTPPRATGKRQRGRKAS